MTLQERQHRRAGAHTSCRPLCPIGGFTLPELLVSLLLTAIFAIAVHQLCLSLLRGIRLLEVASGLQEAARITLTLIGRDLRDAGYGLASDTPGIRVAAADGVSIARDLNGDGDSDDSNERLGYWLDGEGQRILRQMGDAPPQPMLDEVGPAGLRFVYRDGDGNVIPAVAPLAAADLARIRRIDVQLVLEADHPFPDVDAPLRVSRDTSVALRNG